MTRRRNDSASDAAWPRPTGGGTRRLAAAIACALILLVTASAVSAAGWHGGGAPRARAVHGGPGGRGHGAERHQADGEAAAGAFECDTRRAVRTYGSAERCLQVLCRGANVVNAYVSDATTHRLRRNPCAGVSPD